MNSVDKMYMHKPCGNCPFRKDLKGISTLGNKRAKEIVEQNKVDGFVCHKTVDYSLDNGEVDRKRKQCAGAMILARKTNSPQPFLNLYEFHFNTKIDLKGDDLIVDSEDEFIEKQSKF